SAPATPQSAGKYYFKFQAVDGLTGKPVARASILAMTSADLQHIHIERNLTTDAEGNCPIPLGSDVPRALMVGVIADGYEERTVVLGMPGSVPSDYILKLPRGSRIGGTVTDTSGNPIANAEIKVTFYGIGDSDAREFQRERPGIMDETPAARTDAAG